LGYPKNEVEVGSATAGKIVVKNSSSLIFLPQTVKEKFPLSIPAEKLIVSCFLLPFPLESSNACHVGFSLRITSLEYR